MSAPRSGPLTDVRILDLTQALAGPFGTLLLADLGADVVKVEPPQGDMSRTLPPRPKSFQRPGAESSGNAGDYGAYFGSINRNKRSIVLDITSEEGRARFFELVDDADAVVENARVGVMDRLGVGYDAVRARNPRVVYAAIRGFGDPRTGKSPYSDWPAFDVVAQCMGGLVSMTGPLGSAGMPNGASIGDLFPGALLALGIVSAVHHARRTGQGQFLDVGMVDSILALCETMVINYSYSGRVLVPRGSGHPSLCPFDVYETSDGAVAIAAPVDHHWKILCDVIGRPDLVADERTRDAGRRSDNRDFVNGLLREWTRVRTRKEVVDLLGGRVPVGPVNTAADIFADPHFAAREMLATVELPGDEKPLTIPGTPIKFTGTPTAKPRRAPTLGEHQEEVFAEAERRKTERE